MSEEDPAPTIEVGLEPAPADPTIASHPSKNKPASELLEDAAKLLPARFVPVAVIGRGGMGTVIRATDTSLGREVAVKILSTAGRADPVVRARFAREARSAAVLRHPNIVTVYDSDPDGAFMVMELVDGESLRERLRRQRKMSPTEVRSIGRALLAGLGAAHQQQIIHRDVKPANVLVEPDGNVKLADFGVAWSQDSQLTGTGGYVGTPAYMAPEQLRGRVVDGRADLYSVGVTLFEMATGEKLHTDQRSIENPHQVVIDQTGDMALAAAIARAVAERPDERFPSAAAFAEALARLDLPTADGVAPLLPSDPAPPPVEVETTTTPRGMRLLVGTTMMSLVVALASLGAVVLARHELPREELVPVDARRVAFLPFEDSADLPTLDFAEEGLPHLLGLELESVEGLHTLGFYEIKRRLGISASSREAWIEMARKLGATWMVRGAIVRAPLGARVTIFVTPAGAAADDEGKRITFECATSEVPERVRAYASQVAATILGHPVNLASHGYRFDFDRQYLLGLAKLEQHQLPEAMTALEAAVNIDPSSGDAYYYLAVTAWWHERPKAETLGYIQRALDLHPTPVRKAFLNGLRLFVDRRFTEAREYFDKALIEFPEDRDIQYGDFEALYHTGHPQEATAIYRRLIDINPAFRLGSLHVLTFALAQGAPEHIEWALKEVRADDDDFWAVWRPRGLISQRRLKEAIPMLRTLTEKYGSGDTGVAALNSLAGAYALDGQLDLAVALTQRLETPNVASHVSRYALELARGNDVTDLKRRIDAGILEVAQGPRYNWVWPYVLAELPTETNERLLEQSARIASAVLPEQAQDPNVLLLQVMIGAVTHRLDLIGPGLSSSFPELATVAEGARMYVLGQNRAAAERFEAAPPMSGDGKWMTSEWWLAASARRLARDHEGVIRDCAEAIEARVYYLSWPGTVGPCLVYTAQAERALGHRDRAQAAVDRLKRLRSAAKPGDAMIAAAEQGTAP
ncbi:MAG: serine/threonine-protein kinase [Myxococcota bacterium]